MSWMTIKYKLWYAKNAALLGVNIMIGATLFTSDAHNVRLVMCIDGFNPFRYSSKSYSI